MKKGKIYWAGFSGPKNCIGFDREGRLAVFMFRVTAKELGYTDIRKVRITEVKKRKR